MPPIGDFEEAFLRDDGGREGAAFVAEEGGFEQLGGDGAGVDRDEGLVAAWRVGVDGLGDQLFAGAAFALDQDRRAAGRDLRDEVEEAQHVVAFADDVVEGVALLEGALEVDDLLFGGGAADGGADVGEQLLVVPGLLDEVGGARADGVDHIPYSPVGGDHDDRQLRRDALDAGQKVDAAFAGQSEIEQQKVVGAAGEHVEAAAAFGGQLDAEALEREKGFERVADAGFVVDDEDAGRGVSGTDSRCFFCTRPFFCTQHCCFRHVLPFRLMVPRGFLWCSLLDAWRDDRRPGIRGGTRCLRRRCSVRGSCRRAPA